MQPTFDTTNDSQAELSAAIEGLLAGGVRTLAILGHPATYVARRIPALLEPAPESVAVWQHAQAVCGLGGLPDETVPLRAPHHSVTTAAMEGSFGRPGEMLLAAGGVLFLDEVPLFAGSTLRRIQRLHAAKSPLGPRLLVVAARIDLEQQPEYMRRLNAIQHECDASLYINSQPTSESRSFPCIELAGLELSPNL